MDGLIGSTGFVGGTLLRQRGFDRLFASANIAEIDGQRFDTLICAGAPAAKWIANADPDADRTNIESLAGHMARTEADHLILISTVDVFADSSGVDEDSAIDETTLTAYGRNRLWLERFVRERFASSTIVRLPGLVGPGLRKNAIFDLRNGNAIEKLDPRAAYQFYPMVNLWRDIAAARAAGLALVHLTATPLTLADAAGEGFGQPLPPPSQGGAPVRYDFQTKHAALFGSGGRYTYSRRESLMAIRAYAQSEPPSAPLA